MVSNTGKTTYVPYNQLELEKAKPMDARALKSVKSYLNILNDIHLELLVTTEVRAIKRKWVEFLDTVYKIHDKLEKQVVDASIKKKYDWRYKILKERFSDEYLRYLRFARNTSTHDVEEITLSGDHAWVNTSVYNEYSSLPEPRPNLENFVKNHKNTIYTPNVVVLKKLHVLHEKKPVTLNPPIEHLGNIVPHELVGPTPRLMTLHAVKYFKNLVNEAEDL
ncbi:hypothetical protein HN018_25910 (plasmid) [Lichenicola cladoniae]|uniref:Uncharacterized protein n=1 Tax=Lichenicola cladoniae TaxID=1484109 RepID=A0A6M8HYJ6_9PROT|nr:hypothetical protein [Lichenicola cladoniae]NPD70180.1 hypothetical protein [Acetobacteraceae bacterium]QKE93603.1 hypothetical protein HN018_25910 [Lichenicola cladoniae]